MSCARLCSSPSAEPFDVLAGTEHKAALAAIRLEPPTNFLEVASIGALRHQQHAAAIEVGKFRQPGIDLLFKVIDIDNIMFATEMIGAVRGKDPDTGFFFDDTKRYVDALDLSDEDKRKVFELNVRRVYPRLDARLRAAGQ